MRAKILAWLLIVVALAGATGAAQAGSWQKSRVLAEAVQAATHVLLQPQARYFHHGEDGYANEAQQVGARLNAVAMWSWVKKAVIVFHPRVVEKSCLARAVYFEARSESLEGQLAVAAVVLKRVRTPHYPSSVCGVVYQGARRYNACQFSFACDDRSDLPKEDRAWKAALAIAGLALSDEWRNWSRPVEAIATATNYHADYVNPRWSKSLRRLAKIGRHIFYSQG